MAISRIGVDIVEADSVTIPAHQVGDLIVLIVYVIGSTTAPTIPAGWSALVSPTGSSSTNRQIVFRWADSTSETSGTWTGASFIDVRVYRSSAGFVVPGSALSALGGSTLNVAFATLTLRDTEGPSWVAASALTTSLDTDIETAPARLVTIDSLLGTTAEIVAFDTDASVTSFAATNRVYTGTAGTVARMHFELQELAYDVAAGGVRMVNIRGGADQ